MFCGSLCDLSMIQNAVNELPDTLFDLLLFDCADCLFIYDTKSKLYTRYDFQINNDESYSQIVKRLKNKHWKRKNGVSL